MSAIGPEFGTTSPGFGDTLAVPDFVSDIDPRPGEPLLGSEVRSDRPHFVSYCKRLQIQDLILGPGRPPGGSGMH